LFALSALTDTISPRSPFLQQFFSTFTPADTLKKESLFSRKSEQFFTDYFSSDSAVAKKARKYLYTAQFEFDSLDVPLLKNAIEKVNWNTKNYLTTKKYFITKLAGLKDSSITPFLRDLYWKVKDSSELQNLVLESLLRQRTLESFTAFKELILQEPPVAVSGSGYSNYRSGSSVVIREVSVYNSSPRYIDRDYDSRFYGSWYPLYDTLALTKTIFPDILQLGNVDDYKKEVTDLLTVMVDSGFLKAEDYESNFSKYYLDAKQSLKKQVAREEKADIDKASNKDRILPYGMDEEVYSQFNSYGNSELEQYAILLMPFYDKKPGVPGYYEQLLKLKDKSFLYDIFVLMLRNNKPVPDSLFNVYAKQDNYRVKLYTDLQKMNKLEKFPAAWKNQQAIARSLLMTEGYRYRKPDSVVFMDKLAVSYKGKKGWIYFFKYRLMRDDSQWQLASIGMQPENLSEIDVKNDEFTEKRERKLENDKSDKEQMQKMLKELLYAKHESAEEFYRARSFNLYKSYLSEMVKRQRYRD
jgi:hypothetical protein